MTDWTIVHEKPVELTCGGCNGRGYVGDGHECECGGSGTDWFDLTELTILAHNIAIGAALCRAYDLGENPRDLGPGKHIPLSSGVAWIPDGVWRPGCGKAAP